MVSLAEKMAAGMDMSAFSKADELKRRLWFTILALIVFRLGTFIPLPGIDAIVCFVRKTCAPSLRRLLFS